MRLLFPLVASLAIVACSDAERDAAADADGNGSMNAATAAAADTGGPSTIDCARASGQAEQAVCADKELIAIDRALGEMPGYAANAAWTAQRGECSRSDDLRQCLLDLYVSRIADLSSSGMKEGGIVVGPVSLRCGTEDATAIFVNTDPGAVHLRLDDKRVTLPHVACFRREIRRPPRRPSLVLLEQGQRIAPRPRRCGNPVPGAWAARRISAPSGAWAARR